MNNGMHSTIVSFIWGVADDVLRDVYVRGKYRDVILPMTVIRRLDVVLEPNKEAVLQMKHNLDNAGITNQDAALRSAAGQAFYNASPFTLRDLRSRARSQQLRADFEAYLDGFSPNVQEILDKFKFRNQLPTLVDADILGSLIEKFLDPAINLGPQPVLYANGDVGLNYRDVPEVAAQSLRELTPEVTIGVQARDGLFRNQVACILLTDGFGRPPHREESILIKRGEVY